MEKDGSLDYDEKSDEKPVQSDDVFKVREV